jgi:lipopolysaccharide biosynthesis regulator YciM
MIAHFHCEQAESFWRQGNKNQAKRLLGRALTIDRNCVRASLLEAEVELQSGDYKTAIRILKQIEHQEPAYLSEIVEPLRRAYLQWGRVDELIGYLRQLLRKHSSISLMLALADLIQQQEGESEAATFISEYLHTHPSVRGMARLIDLKLGHSQEPSRDDLQVLKELTDRLLQDKPVYCCSHCGFQGKTLNWQCPSCKQWNTTRPIHGIEGE